MPLSLLIVADSGSERDDLSHHFSNRGDTVRTAASASEARMALAEHLPDVAIISLPLADAVYTDLPAALLTDDPDLALILIVHQGQSALATEGIRRGAAWLEKQQCDDLILALADAAASRARMRAELALSRNAEHLPAEFPFFPGAGMLVDLAIRNDEAPVLIVGEPGTGKGLLARHIHAESVRAASPFLELRCTTLARVTLERQLFGAERGATGDSRTASRGLLELADGGALLLSTVGSLPFESQAPLLQYVEDGVFHRTGGNTELRSRVRIMASTTRPLAPSIDAGLFRADLFYRIQVLTIALPPLREQPDSIEQILPRMLPPGGTISRAAVLALRQHNWPGNVRELRNAIWRAGIIAGRSRIELQHLPLTARIDAPVIDSDTSTPAGRATPLELATLEKQAILSALERTGGNKLRAAALLGIARSTLHEKLKRI